MRVIFLPTARSVVETNKFICEVYGNPHHCNDLGKIESAIATAFYPGSYPFALGGIAKVAGALCFYLVKTHAFTDGNKRTAAITAITFMNMHGLDLEYPFNKKLSTNGLADIIESCAAGYVARNELIDWFESHKIPFD